MGAVTEIPDTVHGFEFSECLKITFLHTHHSLLAKLGRKLTLVHGKAPHILINSIWIKKNPKQIWFAIQPTYLLLGHILQQNWKI